MREGTAVGRTVGGVKQYVYAGNIQKFVTKSTSLYDGKISVDYQVLYVSMFHEDAMTPGCSVAASLLAVLTKRTTGNLSST